MDTRRRPPKPRRSTSSQDGGGHHLHQKRLPPSIDNSSPSPPPKASDALPLPLYLTNAIFFTLFFSVAYYLLYRWRDKIRNSTPLHVVTFPEIAAIISLMASFIYLLGFFGIDFVQSFITRSSHDAWELEGSDNPNFLINKDHRLVTCPPPASIDPIPKLPNHETIITPLASVEDEEIIKSVTEGTLPSYSLETKLGDCKRAAVIRREALQRTTGKSLEGLPIEGFDYDSILGQCCEMPVGYVQIPVGIAGPLSLNGMEFMVPMATTEGCLVASTNRGCKALYASGGAISVLYADGMTRAPVVRFETAKRASELKLFLEDPDNFDTLSIVFNRSVFIGFSFKLSMCFRYF
jgi:hydroxymethylglutaryl-CoA reductase (NADPH)